jgi:crotonobetainyl-CoA:carnitine CoA-transferase CaiB-like acyl-CoA transferase
MKGALEGIRVIDFTRVLAGPGAARMLADHGAEVIKIEVVTGELARLVIPHSDNVFGINRSGYYINTNRNKLGVTINLSDPRGLELAKKLVETADVVIENFSAGVMDRLGLGYEALKAVKPDIIMVSMPGFGQTGPYRTYASYGPTLQAIAGITYLTAFPDHEPAGFGFSYSDYTGGWPPQYAILAALHRRRKTGKGLFIDVSQMEALCGLYGAGVLDYVVNKRAAKPTGNRLPHRAAAPHGAYRCKGEDRWCVISVFNEKQWQAFCGAIGNPAWSADEKFATLLSRTEHMDALDSLIGKWTLERTAEEVMEILQHAGVAAGVVQNSRDLIESDPQLRHYQFFKELEHPVIGKVAHENVPFKLSETPAELRRPAPRLGEHNEYVLSEILHISKEEIAKYTKEGVLGTPDLG